MPPGTAGCSALWKDNYAFIKTRKITCTPPQLKSDTMNEHPITIDLDIEDAYPMAEFLHRFHSPVAEVRLTFSSRTGKIIMENNGVSQEKIDHAIGQYRLCYPTKTPHYHVY